MEDKIKAMKMGDEIDISSNSYYIRAKRIPAGLMYIIHNNDMISTQFVPWTDWDDSPPKKKKGIKVHN